MSFAPVKGAYASLRDAAALSNKPGSRLRRPAGSKDATNAEPVEAQDDVDARVAELLARSRHLLADVEGVLGGART